MSEESPADKDQPEIEHNSVGPSAAELGPVIGTERVAAVDVLRGFALLGILVMNIYAFAMPFAAYSNPLLYGGTTGVNIGTWVFTHLFFDQKMYTIFSMLFGAGLVLMGERAAARGVSFLSVYYRRVLWLLAIGLAHAYLLWIGDILYFYAMCGLLLYPLRRLAARKLLTIGLIAILLAIPLSLGMSLLIEYLKGTAEIAEEMLSAGETLSTDQEKALETWTEMESDFLPSPEEIDRQVEVHRGGYADILVERAPRVFMMQTAMFFMFIIWRIGGIMLLGMALMKLGLFAAKLPARVYVLCVVLGYGIGLPLVAFSAYDLLLHEFEFIHVMRSGGFYNMFGSLVVAMGHIGVVMLLCQAGAFKRLQSWLAAVGRMALTNYLMHTVIFTTLFYGYGFGLFGHFNRFAQMGFVLAMWIFQLGFSTFWLGRYRFGPAEWAWRSLTYWKLQPIRRTAGKA